MRTLRLHGPRDARIEDVQQPDLRPGTVRIDVAFGGICGSDLALYQDAPVPQDYANPIMGETGPHSLGHEFAGYVVEVADDVDSHAIGDLVAVQPNFADGTCPSCVAGHPNMCDNYAFIGIHGWGGGFSESLVVPADHAFKLPSEFAPEVAALIEPLAVAWHAVNTAVLPDGGTALVVGAGPIGLSLLLCLKAQGAGPVIVSELSEVRKQLALELGADLVIDPREEDVAQAVFRVTHGRGADASFDASGVGKASLQVAVDSLAPAARAVIVAGFHHDVPLDVMPFLFKEKILTGSFAYTAQEFEAVRDAIVDGRIKPERLISSTISLSEVVEKGIKHLLGEGRSSEVKILVQP
jgi:2-desacetyl-2-hydroxyethyl bacteriochlorophyllide A dehydrogenase